MNLLKKLKKVTKSSNPCDYCRKRLGNYKCNNCKNYELFSGKPMIETSKSLKLEKSNLIFVDSETPVFLTEDYLDMLKKQEDFIHHVDFYIQASNGEGEYFKGFRNGLRFSKGCLDGKNFKYE